MAANSLLVTVTITKETRVVSGAAFNTPIILETSQSYEEDLALFTDTAKQIAGNETISAIVAGVPDEKKGERLIVLHKLKADDLAACLEKLAASDLPNLWKPKADSFFAVDAFPLLGTGKLDLRQVKEKALQFTKG